MSRAFPFLRPPHDVVITGPWSRPAVDGVEPLPPALPDWDYGTVLALRRAVSVDGLRARRLTGLAHDAELDLSVQWYATTSALRGRAWRAPVPCTDGTDITIEFDLLGTDLGGTLELVTTLTLRSTTPDASPAAPTRPGSILWSDRHQVVLQGDNALFPIARADFHDLPYPTGAGWYLHIDHALDAAALGSILLLVNTHHDIVMQALEAAAAPTEADRRVLSTLRTDVLRVLVEYALTHEDFTDDVEYPPGTLGALLTHVLRNAYPPVFTLDALRRERRTSPALFSSRIQDITDLLNDR